jgi:hypothetical protein
MTVPLAKVSVLVELKYSIIVILKANCSAVSLVLGGGANQNEVPFEKDFSNEPS